MMDVKHPVPNNVHSIEDRMDLVNRYNFALGTPGPAVVRLQVHFVGGTMDKHKIPAFVAQCEVMIESRRGMTDTRHPSA